MRHARAALRPIFRFLGVTPTKRTRRYFRNRMTREEANVERWRRRVSAAKAERIEARYARGARAARGGRRPLRAAACAIPSSAATSRSSRWSTSTIEADERRTRPTGLRRRHRAQRHPHPQLPARPPLALSRRPDRVPLSLQPEGPRRRRPRPRRARGLPAQAARLLVAPGAGRRPRLRQGALAGARARRGARAAHSHCARPLRGSGRAVRGNSWRGLASGVADAVLRPARGRAPIRPASRSWSR